jgi:hypothetical protein
MEMLSDERQRQQSQMETMQSSQAKKETKLEQMEMTSQRQDELVTSLRDSLQISSHSYNKLRINYNTVLGERENARLEVERLRMEKDEDLLRRIDAEASVAKSKRELRELREQLDRLEGSKYNTDEQKLEQPDIDEEEWEDKLDAIKSTMEQASSNRTVVETITMDGEDSQDQELKMEQNRTGDNITSYHDSHGSD